MLNSSIRKEEIIKRNNRLYSLVSIIFILAITISATVFYWLNANYKILNFYQRKTVKGKEIKKEINTIKVNDKEVQSGSYVELHFDYCKSISAKGEIELHLVDDVQDVQLIYPPVDTSKSGCQRFDLPIKMPVTIVTRQKRLCFKTVYHPNPLRSIKEDFCSEKFTLLAK